MSTPVKSSLCNHVDTFQQQNVRPSYQPSASLTGTELTSTGQFHPYGGISCARPNEHRNAEAGPSILPIPYGGLLMPHPSGGLSETTAYAEQKQTNTEEEGVPVSHFYCSRIPRVLEWLFSVRRPSGPAVKDHPARTAYR